MPLGRYFAFVGSVLLALLFLADWYMPRSAVATTGGGVDKAVIRIHSRHKWPERIVIDTNLPTIVPPAAITEDIVRKPLLEAKSPREALALAAPKVPPVQAAPSTSPGKTAQKRRTRTARTNAGRIANYDVTGFYQPPPPGW